VKRSLTCIFLICLSLVTLRGADTPQIWIRSDHGGIAGRNDYFASGSSVVLGTNSPVGVSVQWFRDGEQIASSTGSEALQVSAITGNFCARWIVDDLAYETNLLPITAGKLPRSNFIGNHSTGEFYPSTSFLRLLPDGRIVGQTNTQAGVGQNTETFLLEADLNTRTRLHYFANGNPYLHNVFDDGSFLLSSPPHLYVRLNETAPFTMPSEFLANNGLLVAALDRGTQGLLLCNAGHAIGTKRDGTVEFTIPKTEFGFQFIAAATALPHGQSAIHGFMPAPAPDQPKTGSTVRITATGAIDPAFQPIPFTGLPSIPTLLYDGTWARISGDVYERFSSDGALIDQRELPLAHLGPSLKLALTGDVYVHAEGLGVLRYRAAELKLDPTFYLPQQLLTPTSIPPVLVRPDGQLVVITGDFPKPLGEPRFVEANAHIPSTASLPVISQEVQKLTFWPHDEQSRYQRFFNTDAERPRTGDPITLYAPFYSSDTPVARWIPLDVTLSPTENEDGVMHITAFSSLYAGRYQLVITNKTGRALGPIVDLRPRGEPRLANLSGRSRVDHGNRIAIAGFVLQSTSRSHASSDVTAKILARSIGPSLAEFGIKSPLPNPMLQLMDDQLEPLADNDDWTTASIAYGILNRLGAFAPPFESLDASLHQTVSPGVYTALTSTKPGQSGVALTEIYLDDTAQPNATALSNLSFRGYTGTGENVLTGGFVIEDLDHINRSLKILIRAVGPTLEEFDIPSALSDPILKIFNASGDLITSNNDWALSVDAAEIAQTAVLLGAFALPADSLDSAVILTLPPGTYTAQVQPSESSEGIALLEIYRLPFTAD